MSDVFEYDVFLSHSSKDKHIVREIAERLRSDGLKVWFDEKVIEPGDMIGSEIENGLENSCSLAFFMSKNAFDSDWVTLERQTAIFRDPTNKQRRFIPVLIEKCKIPEMLAQFAYIDLCTDSKTEYIKLLRASTPDSKRKNNDYYRSTIQNIPFPSIGKFFKGRGDELKKIEANLTNNDAMAITQVQAIYGLGGVGKSRLAVEYAWDALNKKKYSTVLFVRADDPETLHSNIASLTDTKILNLPEKAATQEEKKVNAVFRWFSENTKWLLIIDNADTEDSVNKIKEYLPQLNNGDVLITSRIRNWGASVKRESLDTISLQDAADFLIERTENDRNLTDDDPNDAKKLAEILGCLPIALELAAAYINWHELSFRKYMEEWEKERTEVLKWFEKTEVESYPCSMAVTWQRTFNNLSLISRTILRLSSFLAPDPIPENMFTDNGDLIKEAAELLIEETKEKESGINLKDAFAELSKYSMIRRQDDFFYVHKMVQEVMQLRIPEDKKRKWIEKTLNLLDKTDVKDPNDVRNWPLWDILRPHIAIIVKKGDENEIFEPTSKLMNDLGLLLYTKALYSEAEPFMWRALEINEASFGKDHSKVAIYLNNLTQLLKDTNRLKEAEPLMRRALKIDVASFGKNHPVVARDLNNLAALFQDTNRIEEAEPLIQRALEINEVSLGKNHPNVAIVLWSYGVLLQEKGESEKGKKLVERALRIFSASFDDNHPYVLWAKECLETFS